jgi:hypothetical protein
MGWQVTATTIRCDWVDDFAVVMVYGDGTAKCAYVNRHSRSKGGKKRLKNCKWPDCPLVNDFRERAFAI